MRKTGKVLLVILLVIIIIGGTLFIYFKMNKSEGRSPFSMLPPDVIFIVETNSIVEAYRSLSESQMWAHLMQHPDFHETDSMLQEINFLIRDNQAVSTLLDERDIFVAAHMKNTADFDFMFIADLKNTAAISGILEESFGHLGFNDEETNYLGINIHQLSDPNTPEFKVYLSIVDNLLVGTFDKPVLESAIKNRDDALWANNEDFQQVTNEISDRRLFNFYFNYKMLTPFAGVFLDEESESIEMIGHSLLYSAFNMYFEDERLSFTGYTNLDSVSTFVTALTSVEPGKTRAHELISNQMALYFSMSFENFDQLLDTLTAQYAVENVEDYEDYSKTMQRVERIMGISLDEAFFGWFGNEIALVKMRPTYGSRAEDVLAYIHAKDIDMAQEGLDKLLTKIRRRSAMRFETIDYKNFPINYLNTEKGIFMLLFGKLFEDLEKPFFTYIEDYVVFSNSMETLKQAIDHYVEGKTLARKPRFMQFKDEFDVKSNVSVFIQMPKIYENLLYYSKEEEKEDVENNKDLILSFARVGFQLVSEGDMILTTFIADHDSLATLDDQLETIEEGTTQQLFNRMVDTLAFKIQLPEDSVVSDGQFKIYYDNGMVQSEGMIERGELTGLWRTYYESGNIKNSVFYENGQVQGQAIFYFNDSENTKKAEAMFENDQIQGIYREYYESSVRKAMLNYNDGLLDGEVEYYHPNGFIKISGEYKDGQKHGKWEYFDERGEFISKERWRKGEKKR